MDILVTFNSKVVGVYPADGIFMQPLFLRAANGCNFNRAKIMRELNNWHPVVHQTWDGIIKFERVHVCQ